MQKKKLATLLLSGAIAISGVSLLAACGGNKTQTGNNTQTDNNAQDKAQAAQNIALETYNSLVSSYDITCTINSDVKATWNLVINTPSGKILTEAGLASQINLPRSDLKTGAFRIAKTMGAATSTATEASDWVNILGFCYPEMTAEVLIHCVLEGYFVNNSIQQLEEDLDKIKDNIKTLTTDYPDYQYTSQLNTMYTSLKQLFDFTTEPTGSYATFDSNVNPHKTSFNTAKTSLSVIFE